MANFTRQVKNLLLNNGCKFVRQGKGDHEIWYSPITGKRFSIDGKITKRTSANAYLRNAGIKEKV